LFLRKKTLPIKIYKNEKMNIQIMVKKNGIENNMFSLIQKEKILFKEPKIRSHAIKNKNQINTIKTNNHIYFVNQNNSLIKNPLFSSSICSSVVSSRFSITLINYNIYL
jgi:uncharacterized protein YaiL (DUF2058 family)